MSACPRMTLISTRPMSGKEIARDSFNRGCRHAYVFTEGQVIDISWPCRILLGPHPQDAVALYWRDIFDDTYYIGKLTKTDRQPPTTD